jgi:hypothetical protein
MNKRIPDTPEFISLCKLIRRLQEQERLMLEFADDPARLKWEIEMVEAAL